MSVFRWIPRKKKTPPAFTIHGDVLAILQNKPPLPSMPLLPPELARVIPPSATPNETCYIIGRGVLESRVMANPGVAGSLRDSESAGFRYVELATCMGAYHLALRGEMLTEAAVFEEGRGLMPQIQAAAEEIEAQGRTHD